eukprot:COSAG05_NODE_17994_length_316_cov_0.396313_2_plen_22_part_01
MRAPQVRVFGPPLQQQPPKLSF